MIVSVPTEVIPVWFVEKWKKENAEEGSPLCYWIDQMIEEWNNRKENLMSHADKEFSKS